MAEPPILPRHVQHRHRRRQHRRGNPPTAERRESKRGGWQNMKLTSVMAAVFLALLAGCAVGPDYHPPKPNVSSQWTSPLVGGETNGLADLAAWWKNFGD